MKIRSWAINRSFRAVLLCLSFNCYGQENLENFKRHIKGTHVLDVGVGLVNLQSTAVDIIGISTPFVADPTPSIILQYEYAIIPDIGIGAYVDYYQVNADINIPTIDSLIDDPLCAIACATGINIADCNCSESYQGRTDVFTLAARVAYHKELIPGLDLYSSVVLGYSFNRRQSLEELLVQQALREADIVDSLPTFIYKVNAGGRYYFSPRWGAYGEFGWSNTHAIRVGITRRFL